MPQRKSVKVAMGQYKTRENCGFCLFYTFCNTVHVPHFYLGATQLPNFFGAQSCIMCVQKELFFLENKGYFCPVVITCSLTFDGAFSLKRQHCWFSAKKKNPKKLG